MFDPFQQAKIQRSYSKLRDTVPEKDMSLDDLKRLSGAGKITGESTTVDHELNAKKAQYIRENNIKPGDKEWFHLWFSRPDLTKADPFNPRKS